MKYLKVITLMLIFNLGLIFSPSHVTAALVNESEIFSDFLFDLEEKEDGLYAKVLLITNSEADSQNFYPTLLLIDEENKVEHGYSNFKIIENETNAGLEEYINGKSISDASSIPIGTKLFLYTKINEKNIKNVYIHNYFTKNERIYEEKHEYDNGQVKLIYKEDRTEIEKFWQDYEKNYPFLGSCESNTGTHEEDTLYVCYELNKKNIYLGKINLKNKNSEQLLEEVNSLLNNGVIVLDKQNTTVPSIELGEIKNKKVSTTYEFKDNDTLLYSWTFNGKVMNDLDAKMNINTDLILASSPNGEKINSLIPSSMTSLLLNFKHKGNVPTGTNVKINVSSSFQNTENLDLYYYNTDKNVLEKVIENIPIIDGYASFNLTHCSEYVLVQNQSAKRNNKDNNVQTSSMNVVLYTIISFVSSSALYFIIKNKSKEIV